MRLQNLNLSTGWFILFIYQVTLVREHSTWSEREGKGDTWKNNNKTSHSITMGAAEQRLVYQERHSSRSPGLELTIMELVPGDTTHRTHVTRRKRAVPANYTKVWGENIPYVLHSSFRALGRKKRETLERAMKYISQHLCVNFIDETYRYRAGSTTWLPQPKYQDGNFIMIKDNGGSCQAHLDLENKVGQQTVTPCEDFKVNFHEMLHMLRGNHMHQGSQRDKYITINTDNINPVLQTSYVRWESTSQEYFDPFSALMYGPMTWSSNKMETWTPIRDDIAESDVSISRSPVEFWELNKMYKCAERFCQHRECGPGYLARVKGVCTCVCPREYDPATNCHFQVDGPRENTTWPKTRFSLFGTSNANGSCPDGFEGPNTAKFKTYWGGQDWQMKRTPEYYDMPWPWVNMPVCTRSKVAKIDWDSWPDGGDFCVIKPKREYCRGDFSEYTVWVRGQARPSYFGNVGDFRYSGSDMTLKLCCRGSVLWGWPLDLPNSQPFRLVSGGSCPVVEGMREYQTILLLSSRMTPRKWGNGPRPWINIFYDQIQIRLCYYMPPRYGCNMEIALDSVESSITLLTPGYRTVREPNRRCFYNFLVPEDARVKITFNNVDLQAEDKLYMRRFHKWQTPYTIDRNQYPYEVISEKNYLSLEWWSSYLTHDVINRGVNFTATIILAEHSCYNESSNGGDYDGDHNYTETFEECLPWSHTTDCTDFPSDIAESFWLLQSGNKCRNPGGYLSQPWCYTYKNGTNCHKRYCDVCNYMTPTDVIKNCSAMISTQPGFCHTSISRYGCFKTCNFTQPLYTPGTCSSPRIPADGMMVGAVARSSYHQGEHVTVQCTNPRDPVRSSMKCTSKGWTVLTHACSANYTDTCPQYWTHHGRRCFRYFTSWVPRREAEAQCSTYGASGTLFQVRSISDQVMLRRFRHSRGDRSAYVHGMWISGERSSSDNKWYFTNTSEELRYFNWTYQSAQEKTSKNCIKMTAEYSWAHDAGAWKTLNCDDPSIVAPFVCQTHVTDAVMKDRSEKCQDILEEVPFFCHGTNTHTMASVYCGISCGVDSDNSTVRCQDPMSSLHNRTSGPASIMSGQVMTFACPVGQFKTSGSPNRACGQNGSLLGSELNCTDTPSSIEVKLDSLRKRRDSIKPYKAYLLDNDHYRVPLKGKITSWFYYCNNDGDLNIAVFNKSRTFVYRHVGTNSFRCDAGYKREHPIPPTQQIAVNIGDVIVVMASKKNVLSANLCDSAMNEVMINHAEWALNITVLENISHFRNATCMVPSFGYKIVP